MEEFDYEEDMTIDPESLDLACLEQSNLAMKYTKAAAQYDKEAKKATEQVKIIRSQLVKEVNSDPEGYLGKGNKATASNIEAYYRDHLDHKAAKERLIEAEYKRDLAKGAADHIAFQKKKMIEILAQLLQGEYFSGPSIPMNIGDRWSAHKQNKQMESITKIASKIIPRKRNV